MSETQSDLLSVIGLHALGKGSFATVYEVIGLPFAFKIVQRAGEADILKAEIEALHSLYTHCNMDSLFALPCPIGFFNPLNDDLVSFPPPPSVTRTREPRPAPVDSGFFDEIISQKPECLAMYAMDRAFKLPRKAGSFIKENFYPSTARADNVPLPNICRLYFGKVVRPSPFFNTSNFLLDANRYDMLYTRAEAPMFPKEQVAEGMGEILAKIHWICGYDGRDIEFVLAGSPVPGSCRYYVIDFNQMRRDNSEGALVASFFDNDPYYPRPNPSDPLYNTFKTGYINACPEENRPQAYGFLSAIEVRFARMEQRG